MCMRDSIWLQQGNMHAHLSQATCHIMTVSMLAGKKRREPHGMLVCSAKNNIALVSAQRTAARGVCHAVFGRTGLYALFSKVSAL